MNPSTPPAVSSTAPASAPASASAQRAERSHHPLIWAAVLVWVSIDAIGDGLLAVRSLLASVTASRSVTPS